MTKNVTTLSASSASTYERMSSTMMPTSATMNIGSIATIQLWRRIGRVENTITKVTR